MKRTVSAIDARRHLGEILEGVYYRDDEVVIERAGKVMAVLIPPHRYEAIERERRVFWDAINELHERNKDVPPEVIQELADEAVRAARASRKAGRASA